MKENVEDAKEIVVGRQYWVNMVKCNEKVRRLWGDKWVPVLGRSHEDEMLISNPNYHYHIDWRFVAVEMWAWLEHYFSHPRFSNPYLGHVIWEHEILHSPIRKLRTCRREHSVFDSSIGWMKRFEAAYADKKSDCRTCPHRGISLVGAPVRDGALVCAGHGLAWDVDTGALKPRTRGIQV